VSQTLLSARRTTDSCQGTAFSRALKLNSFVLKSRATIAQRLRSMDIKRLITHFTYHIEPKPDGGFIARASDPTLPPIEAPTRWELNDKVRQNISTALAAEFPGLNLLGNQQLKVAFHIERTPDGSFSIHSSDPNSPSTEAAPHEIESKFAEKLIGYMGKHVMSQLSPELAAQISSGDIKVFVNRNGLAGNSDLLTPTDAQAISPLFSSLNPDSKAGGTLNNSTLAGTNTEGFPASTIGYSGDSPIKRSTGSNAAILRFLLALLIMGAIMYFFLRHR